MERKDQLPLLGFRRKKSKAACPAPKKVKAVCRDGASKWYIHHQGGGWCTSTDDCAGRAFGAPGHPGHPWLGGSQAWPC